nr:hypothetical protein [Angustibacter aerolatus]
MAIADEVADVLPAAGGDTPLAQQVALDARRRARLHGQQRRRRRRRGC